MQAVNSAICTFCKEDDATLEHLFQDCRKIPVFWSDFVDWLYTCVSHCRQLRLSEELVTFGYSSNVRIDKSLDLFILLAKYHIFHAETNNCN